MEVNGMMNLDGYVIYHCIPPSDTLKYFLLQDTLGCFRVPSEIFFPGWPQVRLWQGHNMTLVIFLPQHRLFRSFKHSRFDDVEPPQLWDQRKHQMGLHTKKTRVPIVPMYIHCRIKTSCSHDFYGHHWGGNPFIFVSGGCEKIPDTSTKTCMILSLWCENIIIFVMLVYNQAWGLNLPRLWNIDGIISCSDLG